MLVSVNTALAQQSQLGIIPKVPEGTNCDEKFKDPEVRNGVKGLEAFKDYVGTGEDASDKRDEILACAIKTGRMHLFMVPFFALYIIEFLLGIAGLLAILYIVYGGYKYVIGGLTQDKETGKKIIFQAILGLSVALGAWIIVNLVQIVLTS